MYKEFKYNSASIFSNALASEIDAIRSFVPEIKTVNNYSLSDNCIIGSCEDSFFNIGKLLAKKFKKPYLNISEGIICSVGNVNDGFKKLSLAIDNRGIYYNPNKASLLEEIALVKKFDNKDISRAKSIIKFIRENKITKFNVGIDLSESSFSPPYGKSILLIDEDKTSEAIKLNKTAISDFQKMYDFATERYPDHNIIIKTHPKSLKEGNRGFLGHLYRKLNVSVISENINPFYIFPLVDAVFTISSQTGFEALIAGKKVYCFGKNFYSNYGLTEDNKRIARRKTKLSLEKLVAASLIYYPRYIDPYTKKLTTVENTLDLIVWLKNKYKRNARYYHCLGFKKWEENYIAKFLKSPENDVYFYKSK